MIFICSKHLFPLGYLDYYLYLSRALKDGLYVLTLLTIKSAEGCLDAVETSVGVRGKDQARRDNTATPLTTGVSTLQTSADFARLQQGKGWSYANRQYCWTKDLLSFLLPLQSFQPQRNLDQPTAMGFFTCTGQVIREVHFGTFLYASRKQML